VAPRSLQAWRGSWAALQPGAATAFARGLRERHRQLQEGFHAETKALSYPELNKGLKADVFKANHSPQT